MRWSEAGYLSQIVLTHALRQVSVSLIFDVRQRMPEETYALRFEADAVGPAGKTRMVIAISPPYISEKGDWACLFELRGGADEEERREYYGADGLQALVLNLFYLRSILQRLRKQASVFVMCCRVMKFFPKRHSMFLLRKPNQPLQRNASTGSDSNLRSPARRG